MKPTDRDIENLVSRSLDGMLNEDEQLELNRELIRSPEARALMEASQEVDQLAGSALTESLGQPAFEMDIEALPPQHEVRHPARWIWAKRLVPGAVAAAILAVVFARAPFDTDMTKTPTVVERPLSQQELPVVASPRDARHSADAPMRTVGNSRPAVKRNTGRDVFGVMGDDGNIYWIEVDRSRTVRKADPNSRTEF